MIKYFVDSEGNYLGGFDGSKPPKDSIEVSCPAHGLDTWNGVKWIPHVRPYAESRIDEYPPIGDQLDSLYHAGIFTAEMAAKIKAVKDKYPKG